MEAYKDRVIRERNALDTKLAKLELFFYTDNFASLPEDEQGRLDGQAHAMRLYSYFLCERIRAFPKKEKK
jgi:hypothetical protein